MASVIDTLVCWIRWAVKTAASYGLDAIEFIFDVFVEALNVMASVLPSDSVDGSGTIDGGILGAVNYVIPLGGITAQFSLLMTAWIAYRVYQWLLGFAKMDY